MSLSQILPQDILHYCYSSLFIALYLPVSFPLIPVQRFPISFSNFRTNLRSESRLYASIFIVSLFINIYQIYNVNKFITKLTMISFSTGSDSAIINVIATNAPSLIRFSPFLYKKLFLSKNSKNKEAAIRLQPSA